MQIEESPTDQNILAKAQWSALSTNFPHHIVHMNINVQSVKGGTNCEIL